MVNTETERSRLQPRLNTVEFRPIRRQPQDDEDDGLGGIYLDQLLTWSELRDLREARQGRNGQESRRRQQRRQREEARDTADPIDVVTVEERVPTPPDGYDGKAAGMERCKECKCWCHPSSLVENTCEDCQDEVNTANNKENN